MSPRGECGSVCCELYCCITYFFGVSRKSPQVQQQQYSTCCCVPVFPKPGTYSSMHCFQFKIQMKNKMLVNLLYIQQDDTAVAARVIHPRRYKVLYMYVVPVLTTQQYSIQRCIAYQLPRTTGVLSVTYRVYTTHCCTPLITVKQYTAVVPVSILVSYSNNNHPSPHHLSNLS